MIPNDRKRVSLVMDIYSNIIPFSVCFHTHIGMAVIRLFVCFYTFIGMRKNIVRETSKFYIGYSGNIGW